MGTPEEISAVRWDDDLDGKLHELRRSMIYRPSIRIEVNQLPPKHASDVLRKTLVIGGAVYAASVPLTAAIVWVASHLHLLQGVDKMGTLDAAVNASLAVGFVILISVCLLLWLSTMAFSADFLFLPFAAAAWIAHHGLSAGHYDPFAFHPTSRGFVFRAPHSFYSTCALFAIVLLVVQMIDVSSHMDDKDVHPFRLAVVFLWTLSRGLPIIGSTWHWISSNTISGLEAIPLSQVSAFGWLCTIVGGTIYGIGFVLFMSWLTKGEWDKKLKDQLK